MNLLSYAVSGLAVAGCRIGSSDFFLRQAMPDCVEDCAAGILAKRVGFELEAPCGRPRPQPKSRPGRDHGQLGGEGGILTQPFFSPYPVFSNMHESRISIGDFYDFALFNCLSCFNRLGPISGYRAPSGMAKG